MSDIKVVADPSRWQPHIKQFAAEPMPGVPAEASRLRDIVYETTIEATKQGVDAASMLSLLELANLTHPQTVHHLMTGLFDILGGEKTAAISPGTKIALVVQLMKSDYASADGLGSVVAGSFDVADKST